ncbi:MAG: DUF5118 domain-containing protein, partial [Longimicrobiales bacterium]
MPAVMPSRLVRSLLPVVCVLLALPASAQTRDYDDVVTSSMRSDAGLFTVHRDGARLLFEIPDSLLGRDMALMSRYASV